ncbi:hypothetical protein K492DRAFT_171567 [Lichtheimia hyalospora FSU 10163]|nr:hypothetical protein K492DRAFT_171567 [Lichtheimia hyalospora FSU 10163]
MTTTTFSDMMNDPNALYGFSADKSASFETHQNQIMTSSVAPDKNNANTMMFPPDIHHHHHHMPDPTKQNHTASMIDASAMIANSSQYLQSNDPASFHFMGYNSVTPAPIVKSQVAVASGEYFNTNTMTLQQQQQQQQQHPPPPPMGHFVYQPNYNHNQPTIYQQPQQPIIESSNLIDGFQNPIHSNIMTATNMYPPPSFVSTSAAPISPPYTYDQNLMNFQPPLMMNDLPSHQPSMNYPNKEAYAPQQKQVLATAGTTMRRQPMPRRHTVSTPYQPVNKGKEPEPEMPQNKLRKVLRAKRHRSLGKLNVTTNTTTATTATSSPVDKWMSPDTSSSSSICSPILSATSTVNEFDQIVLLEKLQQQQSSTAVPSSSHGDANMDEEERLQCLWTECYLEMKTLDDLITHVKETHIGSGKALYYCGWKDCPRNQKPFTKRHKMHNHLRTHTGERPFECTEPGCGKRFSRPDSLTTHAKIHSNVRPYLCQYENCGKAYYHLRSLRKHERTHEEQQQQQQNDVEERNTTHAVPKSGDTQLDWMF